MDHYFYYPDEGIIARRKHKSYIFERYDETTKEWVPNWDLSGICSGDIRSIPCKTEEEAWNLLESRRK